MAAYYRPITLDLGLNRGRERIVRDRERIVYVWKFIEKMDFDLGKIIFIFRRSSFLLKCNLAAAENCTRDQCFCTNVPMLLTNPVVKMSFIQPSTPKTKFQVNF